MITEFSKVTGYKIDTEKHLEFLQTNNKKSERGKRLQTVKATLNRKTYPEELTSLASDYTTKLL